ETGERLICLFEMCCKLETEYEKVLPFYSTSLSEEELNQERVRSTELKLIQNTLSSPSESMFWQRYNKVQLEHLCLKLYLKQYLDEVSVSDESFRQQKLLVVLSPALQELYANHKFA
uniref:Uncharacterized protein n=1 Tax=Sinocyclocheilus grahami TaxID=75366 RepID=A0A672TEN6_SINGR